MAMCDYLLFGLCPTRPPVATGEHIFGFAEFLAALALLVLVYNSTDPIYRFRIAVAPIPLYLLTFVATAVIGGGSLLTDLWFAQRWPAPAWGVSRAVIQAVLGLGFLLLVLVWTWFAYVRPPKFGRLNAKAFFISVYRATVRGSEKELAAVAAELGRSSASLVRYAAERQFLMPGEKPEKLDAVTSYATQALLTLSNRKLCRHIIESSPVTAIAVMQAASEQKKYRLPLGQFVENITTEALLNSDSILYHEDGYLSGLAGEIQPFTNIMYGDYQLLEGMEHGSPLDLNFRLEMNSEQFEVYCRIALCAFKAYIESGFYGTHSYTIYAALKVVEHQGSRDLYKLDGVEVHYRHDAALRFRLACKFVKDVIDYLDAKEGLRLGRLRTSRNVQYPRDDIFDHLAELMFELIYSASTVAKPSDTAWDIQHNTAWTIFWGMGGEGKALRVIRFKLTRLLFDEIKRLETMPNFKSARMLGLVLNVTGLRGNTKNEHRKHQYAIARVAHDWTRRNYLQLVTQWPLIAENCLSGTISFDEDKKRLVKTYNRGLATEPPREYLDLAPAPRPPAQPKAKSKPKAMAPPPTPVARWGKVQPS